LAKESLTGVVDNAVLAETVFADIVTRSNLVKTLGRNATFPFIIFGIGNQEPQTN
jgi:hypothetical protein